MDIKNIIGGIVNIGWGMFIIIESQFINTQFGTLSAAGEGYTALFTAIPHAMLLIPFMGLLFILYGVLMLIEKKR